MGDTTSKRLDLFAKKKSTNVVTLYHGSACKELVPTFGYGTDKRDYGRGLYLTTNKESAKEWAARNAVTGDAWLHTLELDATGLEVFDFETLGKKRALYWMAEILRHRKPSQIEDNVVAAFSEFLCSKFRTDEDRCDVVRGWRADDSYFLVVESFITDQLAVPLLEEELALSGRGIQYCCKSEKAFQQLDVIGSPEHIELERYRSTYIAQDRVVRKYHKELSNSQANMPSRSRKTIQGLYLEWRDRNV